MGRIASIAAVALGAVVLLAGSAEPAATRTIEVRVTMTRIACRAAPGVIDSGKVAFRIVNRTRRSRFFTIAGRRSAYLPAGRGATLTANLSRAGLYRYFCISRGRIRNPRTGVLAVRMVAPPRQPEHRIAVHAAAGGAQELYDRLTGRRFVPRGANYVRLSQQPGIGLYHSTFNVGEYDAARADAALQQLRADGSNVVRVFLNGLCLGTCLGDRMRGVSARYVSNVAGFLRLAKANGIYVILTTDSLPLGTRYEATLNAEPRTYVEGSNLDFLTNGGVQANASFWADFAAALLRQKAPTDVVLAYELRNEAHFDARAKPFNLSAGTLAAPNGRTYDLASRAQKDQLLDDSLVFWIDRVRAAIRAVDHTALVSIGFFAPQEPNATRAGDARLIRTRAAIRSSTADFVDLHTYPGLELTLLEAMENFGVDGTVPKPVVLGEMGAFKSAYPALDEAPYALEAWQQESCRFGVDGWLLWTWDTEEQPELWNAQSGGGAIARAIGPAGRPDPCAPASGPHNVALGRPATASSSSAGQPPANAVDGDRTSAWSAAGAAPQWIEVDLGSARDLKRVRLYVTQVPDGFTIHRVYGRKSPGDLGTLLHEFAGPTRNGDVLEYTPAVPFRDVRYVRVETLTAPALVGWREVEAVSSS
ncbi:MAG TPA: discoidin domain-containing protein [Gaiellaceae bacterium]|nr:discoidin domain-containing protein [Gaiellaceae bacterium]